MKTLLQVHGWCDTSLRRRSGQAFLVRVARGRMKEVVPSFVVNEKEKN